MEGGSAANEAAAAAEEESEAGESLVQVYSAKRELDPKQYGENTPTKTPRRKSGNKGKGIWEVIKRLTDENLKLEVAPGKFKPDTHVCTMCRAAI